MHIDRRYQIANAAALTTLARRDRRVHFMHVAKCGGTTLRYVLEGFANLRGLDCVNEARRQDGTIPSLSGGQVVMGHRRTEDLLTRDDTCYVTVLRDPIRRLRSHVQMHMERFGRSGEALIDELRWSDANAAVHMLTGALGPEGDPVGAAKSALEQRVHLFGFQEDFDRFIALVATMLELDGIIYPRFQQAAPDQVLNDRHDALFAELSQADQLLFDFARELYQRRWGDVLAAVETGKAQADRPYMAVRVEDGAEFVDVSTVYFKT